MRVPNRCQSPVASRRGLAPGAVSWRLGAWRLGLVLPRPPGSEPLRDLRWPVRDLREAHHRNRVGHFYLAAVDLLEEMDHFVEAAELGVVVLDVARRELVDALDVHRVDHGLEDPFPGRVLEAHSDHHDLALAVLLALVAETDGRGLSPALELVYEQGRIEVEDEHDRRSLTFARQHRHCCRCHLPLPLVGEVLDRFLERHPGRGLHLVIVIPDASGPVAEEEEADDLEHPLPASAVPVANVAELLDRIPYEASLLSHLTRGGIDRGLPTLWMTLGQGHHALAHLHHRYERTAEEVPHQHATSGELPDHSSSSCSFRSSSSSGTNGTNRTGTTASSTPSMKRIRSSRPPRSTGQTRAAPGASCARRGGGGSSSAAAVTEMPPNGARSGAPRVPSPTRTSMFS